MTTRRFLLVEIGPEDEYDTFPGTIEFYGDYRILADTTDAWEWNADDPFEREVYRPSGRYLVIPLASEDG